MNKDIYCSVCNGKFVHYNEKKSYLTSRKRSNDNTHFHHGITFFRYGICDKFHYTRIRKTKVIWDPCIRCKFKGITKYKVPKIKNEITTLRLEVQKLRKEMAKYKKHQSQSLRDALDLSELLDMFTDDETEPLELNNEFDIFFTKDDAESKEDTQTEVESKEDAESKQEPESKEDAESEETYNKFKKQESKIGLLHDAN